MASTAFPGCFKKNNTLMIIGINACYITGLYAFLSLDNRSKNKIKQVILRMESAAPGVILKIDHQKVVKRR
mgnify:CR=1 FL=1